MYEHCTATPSCATLYGFPAIVNAALRAAPVFASTLYTNVPGPVAGSVVLVVIHEGNPVTVQLHPAVVVTLTRIPPVPLAGKNNPGLVGLIAYVQFPPAASCDTVYGFPATVICADLAAPEYRVEVQVVAAIGHTD